MSMTRLIPGTILALCIAMHVAAQEPDLTTSRDVQIAFERLVGADHRRDVIKARDELADYGEQALPMIVVGTQHDKREVRESCFEILLDKFPDEQETIDAMIAGLRDKDASISYLCAFRLGDHETEKTKTALKACARDTDNPAKTRYAAAKSLAERGDDSVLTMLHIGLGSDDHYTRYLSNIGIRALTGKDLTDFGYGGPWEGAFVSGPIVIRRNKTNPIVKATKIIERWRAIVAFLEWLRTDRPELFGKLDDSWI